MHFSILDFKEQKNDNGHPHSSYVAYSVFINGVYHSEMRYSQLHDLNDKLKAQFGGQNMPYFPPKTLFPMSQTQLEQRRTHLEKYLQGVSQHNELVNSLAFRKFLLTCQRKSCPKSDAECDLVVWLTNGNQITVKSYYGECCEIILRRVCEHLRLPKSLVPYFLLYIQRVFDNGDQKLIYILSECECPLITMSHMQGQLKILLRKCCWDPAYDMKLMSDRIALNLLYQQTVSDIEKNLIVCSKEVKDQLAMFQSRGAKREYLDMARLLKFYGSLRFDDCTCDYPEVGTECVVSIGFKGFVFTPTLEGDTSEENESHFRITRIRCWKIIPLKDMDKKVQLSFQYLASKDELIWVNVISEYIYFISICLQSIVDELMTKKNGVPFAEKISLEEDEDFKILAKMQESDSRKPRKKESISDKFGGMSMTSKSSTLVGNNCFENIGDDDL